MDGGRPSGSGLQERESNDPVLLVSKETGGERFGKRQRYYCHVRLEKLNESELFDEASKSELMSKRVRTAAPRQVQRTPVYCLHGIRR